MPVFTTDPTLLGVAAVLGYLLGSIPFGMVLAKVMGLGNLRYLGSVSSTHLTVPTNMQG